jgi:hypothetical protein
MEKIKKQVRESGPNSSMAAGSGKRVRPSRREEK